MGRFNAGDRVKILAGHPYHAGRESQGEEMTGVVKNDEGKAEGRRGKYLVEVDGGWLNDYSFKGRELELIVDVAEPTPVVAPAVPSAPWVPKVGDRVRVKDSAGGGKVGDECVVTDVTEYGDGSDAYCRLDGLSDGAEGLYSYRLEPLPVVGSAPLTLEVGRFYTTRDGRKVGPIGLSGDAKWPLDGVLEGSDSAFYEPDGTCPHLPHRNIVAEWVEPVAEAVAEPAPVVTPTTEVNVGDRVWDIRRDGTKCNGATVSAVRVDGKFTVNWDDGDEGEHWWSLKAWDGHAPAPADDVEPAASPAKFKVGDRVKSSGNNQWEYLVEAVHDDTLDVSVIEKDGSKGLIFPGTHISKFSLVDPAEESPEPAPAGSFIVARLTAKGEPRPNVRPRVHSSIEAAEAEAQRLADRLGDEFAVYQQVSSKTVDAGPVPPRDVQNFRDVLQGRLGVGSAFQWSRTKQGWGFWHAQSEELTHVGRAILKQWIAEAEATTTKEAA